jgi:hypothetical protein
MLSHSSSASVETITSPRTLKSPLLDVKLNSFINNLYGEVNKSEQERLIRQRAAFIAWLKSNYDFHSKNASTNTTSIFNVLKTRHMALMQSEQVDEAEWDRFITYFNSIKNNDFQKNTAEFNFYLLVRNELELVFFQNPQFVNFNSLDDQINLINQTKKITEKNYQQLILSLTNLHYSNVDPSLRVAALKDLTPAIEALCDIDLFNKINFIRLLLQVNTKDKKGSYYRRSKVDCATTSEYIVALKKSELLNQHNLELIFKLFNIVTNEHYKIDVIAFLVSLRQQLGEDKENDMTRLQQILLASFPDYKIELTENELLRLGLTEDDIDEQVAQQMAFEYHTMLTQISLTEDEETEEKAPESLLTSFAKTTHLRQDEIRKLANKAKVKTPDLAGMILSLHKYNMVTAENFIMMQYVIDNLQTINACFTILTHYNVYPSPQETLNNISTISPVFLEAIWKLIFWLPENARDPETCLRIIENASYAKDLLTASAYESAIFPERNVLEILNSNLQYKESLASLIHIFEKIGTDHFHNYQTQFEVLTANKLYATPDFAKAFKEAISSNPQFVVLDIASALQGSVHKHNQWIEYLNKLNTCELIFVNSTTGYKTDANAAYFFRWDDKEDTKLISVAYSNKIYKVFVEFKLSEESLMALAQAFTKPVQLTLPQLAFISRFTQPHTHTMVSERIIKELVELPEALDFKYMCALIASLQLIHQKEAYDPLSPIIKSYFQNNLELTQGLIKLIDNNLYEIKYISLLELRADEAVQIADILIKLKNIHQLTDLNFLRFATQLANYPDYLSHYYPVKTDQDLVDFLYCEGDELRPLLLDAENDDDVWTDSSESTLTEESVNPGGPNSSLTGRLKNALGDPDDLRSLEASLQEPGENEDEDEDTAHTQIPKAYEELEPTHTSLSGATDVEEVDEEEEEHSVQLSSPSRITSNTGDTIRIDFDSLVSRCREDKNSGCCPWLFTRSPFLEKVDKNEITTIEEVEAYAKEHPTSRTSRIYLHMKMEKMNVSPVKNFLTTYFSEYTFSLFQRSKLVPKLLENCSIETINDHAELEPGNRTSEILARSMRL